MGSKLQFLKSVVMIFLLTSGLYSMAQAQAIMLFSEDEANDLRMNDQEWLDVPRVRSAGRGPVIVFEDPEVVEADGDKQISVVNPAGLRLRIEPQRSDVDMDSLRVRAKKGMFFKTLTDLFTPHIQGNSIDVKEVEVPVGKFHIEVSIADVDGERTVETYRLQVDEM